MLATERYLYIRIPSSYLVNISLGKNYISINIHVRYKISQFSI